MCRFPTVQGVSAYNPCSIEGQHIYTCIPVQKERLIYYVCEIYCIWRDLLWGIGSPDCGGWEVPWSTGRLGSPMIYCLQTTDPGKASSIIQSESEDLRSRGAYSVNPSPRTREGEVGCPSSTTRQEKRGKSLLPRYVLFQQSVDWMMSTHIGKDSLLSPWFKC